MRRFKPVNGSLPSDLRFSGGAVGFIGYEFIHDVEPVVPRPPQNDLQTPVMYFMIADQLLAFDRVSQTITLIVNALVEDSADAGQEYDKACEAIEGLLKSLAQPCQHHPADFHNLSDSAAFESNMPKDTFLKHVQRSKAYIQAGDIIQVVGSQRFSAPLKHRRWMFIVPLDPSTHHPTCSCWNSMDAPPRSFSRTMSAARIDRSKFAPSPAPPTRKGQSSGHDA